MIFVLFLACESSCLHTAVGCPRCAVEHDGVAVNSFIYLSLSGSVIFLFSRQSFTFFFLGLSEHLDHSGKKMEDAKIWGEMVGKKYFPIEWNEIR